MSKNPHELGAFSPATASMILSIVEALQGGGLATRAGQRTPANPPPKAELYFRNDTGEEIPIYGCVQATGTVEIENQNYFTVEKPADTSGDAGPFLFNLHEPVPAGEYGIASAGRHVRCLSTAGTDAGTLVGPTVDAFTVQAGSLLNIAGPDSIADGRGAPGSCVRAFWEGAGGGMIIRFQIEGAESGEEPPSGDECAEQPADAVTTVDARVLSRPCGLAVVPGEVDEFVEVVDTLGSFLEGRNQRDIEGKEGVAAYVQDAGGYECHWMIIWIDWFEEQQLVSDVVISDSQICIEKGNAKLWDWCELPEECIEGEACPDEGSGS